jgi:hypothetical protein
MVKTYIMENTMSFPRMDAFEVSLDQTGAVAVLTLMNENMRPSYPTISKLTHSLDLLDKGEALASS